jgi:hypothetical protein
VEVWTLKDEPRLLDGSPEGTSKMERDGTAQTRTGNWLWKTPLNFFSISEYRDTDVRCFVTVEIHDLVMVATGMVSI